MENKVVNLRQARKRKARAEKRRAGDARAAQSGLSKTQRDEAAVEEQKLDRYLDPHFRERD